VDIFEALGVQLFAIKGEVKKNGLIEQITSRDIAQNLEQRVEKAAWG
jgi:hypothetical protein